jgi:beta-glucosidase
MHAPDAKPGASILVRPLPHFRRSPGDGATARRDCSRCGCERRGRGARLARSPARQRRSLHTGYTEEGATTAELLDEARKQAKDAHVAIVFAGLPDSYESEDFDRASLDLPAGHNELMEAVSAVQPNIVVVLMNGSAVTMPWAPEVKAIVEAWLGGQAGGGAIADALTGRVNPSGKLSETFPLRLEDTPPYPHFPARNKEANYSEGIFIGYRHYDVRKVTRCSRSGSA